MKAGRIPCCVPFCRRTAPERGICEEILCGRHFRLARPALRRRLTRVRRIARRAEARGDRPLAERAVRLDWALWVAIKREAIEIAAGISG